MNESRARRGFREPVVAMLIALAGGLYPTATFAQDWPTWGGDASRNMVSSAKGLPVTFNPGKVRDDGTLDLSEAKNVKWVAKLGSQSYGNLTVAGGRIYLGTNNDPPHDPRFKGDYGVLLCLEESTGKLLWQLIIPKLATGQVSDYENVGLCSSPTVEGDRVYIVTNRCEVLCLDAKGMADGNDGPFKDEGQYIAGAGNPPTKLAAADADIIWRFDMRDELGVFPHQMTSSSVLLVGDRLYVTTSNGRDWTLHHIPAPNAPSLICLDKKTGALLGRENSLITSRIFLCTWSSPAMAVLNGRPTIIFGADDGWCYGFDPVPDNGTLKELWRFDCNPPEHRFKNGKPIKYSNIKGPCGILATPVSHGGRIYVAIGRNPEDSNGAGCLNCIEPSGPGDISKTGKRWSFTGINPSISTASVADGLLYIADLPGFVYCIEADTGKVLWSHDTMGKIWGSTLLADGKLYVGGESSKLTVLAGGRELKVLSQTDFDSAILSTPVAANGTLYVASEKFLYALREAR